MLAAWIWRSLVIRELTLRSAASFGSFHLIRLLYDEYVSFLIERRVAEHRREPPIAVMQRAMDDDDELPEPQDPQDPLESHELHDGLEPQDGLEPHDALDPHEPPRSEEEDGDQDWDWEDDDEPDSKRMRLDE